MRSALGSQTQLREKFAFECRKIEVEGVADRLDLPPRVDTIGLRHFFCGWGTILSPSGRSQKQDPENQKTDLRNQAGICHGKPLFGDSDAVLDDSVKWQIRCD